MRKTMMAAAMAVAGWLAASSPACAQELPGLDSVREALRNDPEVLAAAAQQRASGANAAGLRAGHAETVIRATGQTRRVRETNERFGEGQLALERPLRLWGKSGADGALAESTEAIGRIGYEDAMHEASRRLLRLWYGAVRAQAALGAAQETERLSRQTAQSVARRAQLGDASRMESELAQADLARAIAATAAAQTEADTARDALHAQYPQIASPGVATDALPAQADMPERTTLRRAYIESSHALRLARAEGDHAARAAKRADLERYPDPTVGVFATVERGGQERIVGVSLAVPFAGPARRSAADAAVAQADAAAQRTAAAERQLGAEFDAAYSGWQGRRASAQALLQALATQRQATDRVARAYTLGEANLIETLTARRTLAETVLAARTAVVDAREAQDRLRLDLHQLWDLDD